MTYFLQLVDEHGRSVLGTFRGVKQRDGSVSIPLIDTCVREILARNVGFGRTERQVEQAIRDGMAAAIQCLKDETLRMPRGA